MLKTLRKVPFILMPSIMNYMIFCSAYCNIPACSTSSSRLWEETAFEYCCRYSQRKTPIELKSVNLGGNKMGSL
jgi:hypothetical protein